MEEHISLLAESSYVVHPSTGCDGVVLVHHHAVHQHKVKQHLQGLTIHATTTQIVTPTSAQGPKSGYMTHRMEMVIKVDGINTILVMLNRRVGAHSDGSRVYTLTPSHSRLAQSVVAW